MHNREHKNTLVSKQNEQESREWLRFYDFNVIQRTKTHG